MHEKRSETATTNAHDNGDRTGLALCAKQCPWIGDLISKAAKSTGIPIDGCNHANGLGRGK